MRKIDGIYLKVKTTLAKPENKKRFVWGSLITAILGILFFAILNIFPLQKAQAASNTVCTWTGATNTVWENTGNWSGCTVSPNYPSNNGTAYFWASINSATATNWPVLSATDITVSGVIIGNVTANANSKLSINSTDATHGRLTIANIGTVQTNFIKGSIIVGGASGTYIGALNLNPLAANTCLTTTESAATGVTSAYGTITSTNANCTWSSTPSATTNTITNSGTMSGQWSRVINSAATNAGTMNMTAGTFTNQTATTFTCSATRTNNKLFAFTAGGSSKNTTLAGQCTFLSTVTITSTDTLTTGAGPHESTQTSGTAIANSGTFTSTGNTWIMSGTTSGGSLTIATATSPPISFVNLQLGTTADANNMTYNLGANTTVTTVLTVGATSGAGIHYLGGSSYTLTLSNAATSTPLLIQSSGGFTAGTSTVNYTGALAGGITITMAAATYNNLGAGTTTDALTATTYNLDGNTTVGGTLTVGYSTSTNSDVLGGGSYTLTLSGTGTPFTRTTKGIFTCSTSTVTYTSASGVTALAAAAMTGTSAFYNLIINGSGNFPAGVAMEVKNQLTVTAGTMQMAANALTVGNASVVGSGVISVAGGLTQTSAALTTILGDGGTPTIGGAGTITFYNLSFLPTVATPWTLGTGASQTITIDGTLTVGNGANAATVTVSATNNPTIDVNTNVSITAASTLAAAASGVFNVTGNWTNAGTFTHNSGTITFDGAASGKTINTGGTGAGKDFYNVTFNGSGVWSPSTNTTTVTNDLTMTAGTFNTSSGTANVVVNGNVQCGASACGTISMTATNTFTQSVGATENFGTSVVADTTAWAFYNLTFSSSAGSQIINTSTAASGNITVGSVLTISGSTTLNAGNRTWILSGIGTPFGITGTFGSGSTSTFRYTGGNGTTNITASANYNNLEVFPSGATATHNFASAAYTVGGYLSLGGNGAPAGAAVNAANATLTLKGNVTVCATTCSNDLNLTKSNNTVTWNASGTDTWTDNSATKEDLGIISITGGSSTPTVTPTTSVKATSVSIDTGQTLNLNGSNTLTLVGNTTPFSISGTFTPSTGTIEYAPAATTGVNVASTTYHHVTFNKASNTFSLQSGGIATDDNGNLTITAGILDTVNLQNYSITVGGNWVNSDTFTPRSGTVTFNRASPNTQTVNAGGTGAGKPFNNFTHSGTGTLQLVTTAIDVGGNFSQTNGIFDAGTNNLSQNFSGDFALSNGTTYTKGGTLTFDKTITSQTVADATDVPGQDLGAVTIGPSTTTSVSTANKMNVTDLTIGADDTLDISSDTLSISGNYINSNTLTATGSTVDFTGSGTQTLISGGTGVNKLFNNLTHSGTGTLQIITNDLDIDGNFDNSNASGTFDANSKNITLAGNYSNSGTFTDSSALVTLDGAAAQNITCGGIDANHDFYNLTVINDSASGISFADSCTVSYMFDDNTAPSKLTFHAGSTYAFTAINIDGTAGNSVTMVSSSPGSQWLFNVSGSPTVSYVNVTDSDARGGSQIDATNNCIGESQNNLHWLFAVPTLSFSLSSFYGNTITFANLNSDNNWTDVKTGEYGTTVTTSTNASNGYMVKAYITQLLTSLAYPTKTIQNYNYDGASWAAPKEWPSGKCDDTPGSCGFGYTSNDPLVYGSNRFADATKYAPFSQTAQYLSDEPPVDVVADSTGPVTNEQFIITYKVAVSSTQAASTYQTYAVYIVTANY